MRFLLALLFSLGFFSGVRAENKFDFATTPGKLPKEVVPEEYAIRIVPNLKELGTNEKKFMLGTQFEATDARRMFPCWDEPSFRARFQLTTVVPEKFLAVSNMPVESEQKAEGGKEVRFAMSPSMASYLVVFV